MTLRDDIWDEVIILLVENGRLKISDLPFDEGKRHTVRRVLHEMEALEWVERTGKQGKIWYAGPKAEKILNLSPRAELLADPEFEV